MNGDRRRDQPYPQGLHPEGQTYAIDFLGSALLQPSACCNLLCFYVFFGKMLYWG